MDAGKRCLYLYKKSDCPDKEQEANLKDIKAVPFEVVGEMTSTCEQSLQPDGFIRQWQSMLQLRSQGRA